MMELSESVKKTILDYEKKQSREKEFHEKQSYLTMIDDFMDKNIDNDTYGSQEWTEEIDLMFNFLFNKASELVEFEDEIAIKYKDKTISLLEMHGQGCFKKICPLKESPDDYVIFEDICNFEIRGKKPIRVEMIDIINVALDSLQTMSDGLHLELDISNVKSYVKNNLK